ncbi:MAG: hypothetical protein HY893_01365 [Deltaproteobacteria bacterium]|nr:hypothetical protein [Deltaproteobacteria bacterium]
MLNALIIVMAILLPLVPAKAFPQEKAPEASNGKIAAEADYKLKANTTFINAAEKIVKESGDAEAASILKMARASAEEARQHYGKGEYEFASEDAAESTRMATHAIVISKNRQDSTIRDSVIREEAILRSKHDAERKEAMIKKGLAEVETFIKTADMLASEYGSASAPARIGQAKAFLAMSKTHIAGGDLDSSLEEIKKAYKLITDTVREMKRERGEIITFPRPAVTDEKEMLTYELKKNDSYLFFAEKLAGGMTREGSRLLGEAKTLQGEAMKAMDAGDRPVAIEKLKASTELYIKAVKSTSGQ